MSIAYPVSHLPSMIEGCEVHTLENSGVNFKTLPPAQKQYREHYLLSSTKAVDPFSVRMKR